MLQINSDAFINFPGDQDNQRVLHPITDITTNKNTWVVTFEETDITVKIDQEIILYYTLDKVFMQQSATVTEIHDMAEDSASRFEIELIGKPVSAESRQCFRVCTVLADWWIKIGSENHCQIADISHSGCAIICRHLYNIGETIKAEINFQDTEYIGSLRVQSIKDLGNGEYRYGLLCLEDKAKSGKLQKGLQKMSMDMQRTQLRRLSGAA